MFNRFRGAFTIGETTYPTADGKNKKEAKERSAHEVIKVLQSNGAIDVGGKLANTVRVFE